VINLTTLSFLKQTNQLNIKKISHFPLVIKLKFSRSRVTHVKMQ